MFYSHNILTRKGGSLGIVWIAANFQPGIHHISLTRREYCSVSIRKACEEVMSPLSPMALRLSASLMVGIVRIHSQQTHYTYVESKHVWQRLKHAYEKNRPTTDLPVGHSRSDAVTLPDPTTQAIFNTSFPGHDHSFSLDSLLTGDLFSMTAALRSHSSTAHPVNGQGSPFTADPRDISMEEDAEAPLEALQIQVPGEVGDFGDGVLVVSGGGEGPVVMMDDVPMPTLNHSSDSISVDGGAGEISSDSVYSGGQRVKDEEEEEEDIEGENDSILLFDNKTDSFQLYKEDQPNAAVVEQGTPTLNPAGDGGVCAPPGPAAAARQGGGGGHPVVVAGKRARRKLAFDMHIKTKSTAIKDNLHSVHTTLREKHTLWCPMPRRVKSVSLLSQPAYLLTAPQLQSLWRTHTTPLPHSDNHPEFALELLESRIGPPHATPSVASLLSNREVARGPSLSQLSSPGGSAVELPRAGDSQTLDSHHTTGLTAILSDVSSFASGRHHSNVGFDASSAQRQISGNNRAPLSGMEGLSPIADVERESEASFSTQHGELLEFPDLDVSYGSSSGTPCGPRVGGGQGSIHSPVLESEPLAYLSHVVVSKMGGKLEVEFQELLPPNSSRRTASRAFSHILELVSSQVLTVTQEKSFGSITLHRGPQF